MTEQSILDKSVNAISQLSNLFVWDRGNDDNLANLASDERMIALGDALQGVLKDSTIKIPRIITLGTQSSGKSSVLNSLIGMDILPTGKQMVTRTPLHLEVVHNHNKESKSYAEFGEYNDGLWDVTYSHELTFPKPTAIERSHVSEYIESETRKKAGEQRDISETPINLRIVSHHVTNLSLVDLPGLTAVACTDQGQPPDIKDKIERLVGKFASQESTLILAILPGRADLEADMGLEIVKKYDPSGTRTVGVLTKLDLMNDAGDVVKYLENKVSKDLQLKHGYFAVKNRNSNEKDTLSVEEGLEKERTYFQNHPLLSRDTLRLRVGSPSLKRYLAHLLTNAMKMSLPSIQSGINRELSEVETQLNNLGEALPEGEEAKISYMHTLLVQFARDFTSYIKDRGSSASTGRNIRDILVRCREELQAKNAFKMEKKITDSQLQEIVLNSEGNHMSFPYPPVEILERCLQDSKMRPMYELNEPIQSCNNTVTEELVKLVSELIENSQINRFPELRNIIRQETIQNVIIPNSTKCSEQLEELVTMQENYIWTDDEVFRESLLAFGKEDYSQDILPALRNLLKQYIDSITVHLCDTGPKTIMLHLVNQCTSNVYSVIYPKLATKNASKLLTEDTEVERKRSTLVALRTELKTALTTIERLN